MDLQFCLDSYAVVTYVCDYWSKDESGMTDFLKQAFKDAHSLENRELLSHLKRTYMSKRQVRKCEAIYRAIPSMHLQGSNIGTVKPRNLLILGPSKIVPQIAKLYRRLQNPQIASVIVCSKWD